MPLIILGLLVVIGIIVYWFIVNQSSDNPVNPRDIEDKISSAAQEKAKDIKRDIAKKIRKRAGIYDIDYDIKDDGYGNADDNTIPFPKDVEREKRKRDIK